MKMIPLWMSISVDEIAYQKTRYRIGGKMIMQAAIAATTTPTTPQRTHQGPHGRTIAALTSRTKSGRDE